MAPHSILVADEDTDTRIILRALLERHGYAIVEAANAQQAMSCVTDGVGVVILNHPMMATPNITLARWLRAQPETRDVPIINLTSRAVPNYAEEAARQGITISMPKPVDVQAILELIRNFTASVSTH